MAGYRKFIPLVASLWLILGILTSCGEPNWSNFQQWREYTSDEGRFSIKLPKAPSRSTHTVDTGGFGKVEMHVTRVKSGQISFGVNYGDYPQEPIKRYGKQRLLDAFVDGALRSTGATLIEKRSVRQGAHPGRAFHASAPLGLNIHQEIYLVGERHYTIIALVPQGSQLTAAVPRFLASFSLKAP